MWFKVDDRFWCHPKVVGLSDAAQALWLRAGSWCGLQENDGLIPESVFNILQLRTEVADELVEAGLWEHVMGDYGFHDWQKYQFTAEEIDARRKARAEAGRRGGKASGRSRREASASSKAEASASSKREALLAESLNPVPSRPDPTRPKDTYIDPSVPVSRRGREDGTDHFQGFYEQHHIDPARVQSVWSQVFGEDITGMEIVALFQQLQMRAKATILDGTGYILATIRDQPGTCQNLLVKGAA